MTQTTLVQTLTDLSIPRDSYYIQDFERLPPGEDRLGLGRSKHNPFRTSLWETYYIERGEKVSIHYFRNEEVAVGMMAWLVIENLSGEERCPISTGLHMFFSAFKNRWMAIDRLDFQFNSHNIFSPATVSGSCGRFQLIVESSQEQVSFNLSTEREHSPKGRLVVSASGKEWDDCADDWLPMCQAMIANYIPKDRFLTKY